MNRCRRTRIGLLVIALTLFVFVAPQTTEAKDAWTRVQSRNFTLVGNAGEKEWENAAIAQAHLLDREGQAQLNQFARHMFSPLE